MGFWFKASTKRKNILDGNSPISFLRYSLHTDIVIHCFFPLKSLHRLFLEVVVSGILRLYNALRSYFGSICKYKPRLDDFETYLMNDNVTMYHFLCISVFGL